MPSKTDQTVSALLAGNELSEEDIPELIMKLKSKPSMLASILQLTVNQRSEARSSAEKLKEANKDLEKELAALREPPLYPADVLRLYADNRLDVVLGGRRLVVKAVPEFDFTTVEAGDEVLLDKEGKTVVRKNEAGAVSGVVATVKDVDALEDTVVLRGAGDEEIVALCPARLRGTLETGDRVLVRRESQCVTAKLRENNKALSYALKTPPGVTFEHIGGLDRVAGELRDMLDLSLEHRATAEAFCLQSNVGAVLVGPPGVGKSMIAAAMANHLMLSGQPVHFLNVKPGELRGMYYGQTEARMRELFDFARKAEGVVVIFFDEVENFGVRGDGQSIDSRALDALLAEIDGIERADNLFIIAATNRLDLCDEALIRHKRIGDAIHEIPRPDSHGARQIFSKYLAPELPYGPAGDAGDALHNPEAIAETAIAHLYANNGGHGPLATAVMADSHKHEIMPRHVMSGALIAGAVEQAKRAAALRAVHDDSSGGVLVEDVLAALDNALEAETKKLRSPQAARRMLALDNGDQIVRVELVERRPPPRHRYQRAA